MFAVLKRKVKVAAEMLLSPHRHSHNASAFSVKCSVKYSHIEFMFSLLLEVQELKPLTDLHVKVVRFYFFYQKQKK